METTGKPVSPSKNLVQETEINNENRYSDPDSNKMKINYAKEPREARKNNLKEEILQVINDNFIEMLLDNGPQKCTGHTQEIQRQQK
jgi:hypothetical protein